MDSESNPEEHPRVIDLDLAEKFGGDELHQTFQCAIICIDFLSVYLLVHSPTNDELDATAVRDIKGLPDMLDKYGMAGALHLIPLEREFILASDSTVSACGMTQHSAHALVFNLVKRLVGSFRQATDDSARVRIVWSLSRDDLLGVRAKLHREWVLADSRRRSSPSNQESDPAEQQGEVPRQVTASKDTTEGVGRRRGGRPREWDALWRVVEEMKSTDPHATDEQIVAAYNQRYSHGISKGKRKKAGKKNLQDLRYDRTKRKRTQDH